MLWQPNMRITRDPDSRKPWRWEFGKGKKPWLVDGDTISQVQVVEQGNLTVTATPDGTDVVMWVEGSTPGTFETVTVRLTTTDGLIDDFSVVFVQEDN